MGFGKKLEEKMSEKGFKQADLVRATGISKTTLSSMINRDNTKVDVEVFIRICAVLGCKPEDFTDEILSNTANQGTNLTVDEKPLDENEKRIITVYRSFNDEGKEQMLDYVDTLDRSGKYKKCDEPGVVQKEENA